MSTWVTRSGGSIVAVNIQYRLGLLGFLASKDVMENGSANNGLLDQRAAIAWVKRHISKFGGNPDQITLAGQSAVSLRQYDAGLLIADSSSGWS
jgi:carboxylesterase type B